MKNATIITICVLFLAGAALADWDRSQPSKYFQLPDLELTGLDVKVGETIEPGANEPITTILADDFPCYQRGLITDIHIWGSWKKDILPLVEDDIAGSTTLVYDPGAIRFKLGIWSDVPAILDDLGNVLEHSHPKDPLWSGEFGPDPNLTPFVVIPWKEDILEGWYNPVNGEYIPSAGGAMSPGDTICWQYNFFIDEALAFEQEGPTADGKPTIYWLSVDVIDIFGIEEIAEFGWKTSLDHWNDDAAWQDQAPIWVDDGTGGGFWAPRPWNELLYPDAHEFQGKSIDMAFAITPEPATMTLLAIGGVCVLRRRRK